MGQYRSSPSLSTEEYRESKRFNRESTNSDRSFREGLESEFCATWQAQHELSAEEIGLKAEIQQVRANRFIPLEGVRRKATPSGNTQGAAPQVGPGKDCGLRLRLIGMYLLWACLRGDFSSSLADAEPGGPIPNPRPRNLSEVRDLTPRQLSNAPACDIRGVITYCDPEYGSGFVHDGTDELYYYSDPIGVPVHSGDRVRLKGSFANGRYSPIIIVTEHEILGREELPEPLTLSYDQLFRGDGDARWVQVETQIVSIEQNGPSTLLTLRAPGGLFKCIAGMWSFDTNRIVLGADVRIKGVAGSVFDRNGKFVSIQLLVPTKECIERTDDRDAELNHLALSSIGSILTYRHRPVSSLPPSSAPLPERIRGTVTCFPDDRSFFLQDSTGGIEAYLQTEEHFITNSLRSKIKVGEVVEITGFSIRDLPSVRFLLTSVTNVRENQSVEAVDLDRLIPDEWPSGVVAKLTATFLDQINQSEVGIGVLQTTNNLILETRQILRGTEVNWWNPVYKGSKVVVQGVLEFQPPRPGRVLKHTLWVRNPNDIKVLKPGFFLSGKQAQQAIIPIAIGWLLAIAAVGILSWRMRTHHRLIARQYREREAAEGKYQSLVKQSVDPIFSFDLEGRLTENNPTVEQLTGWSAQELRSRYLVDLVEPSSAPHLVDRLNALRLGKAASAVLEMKLRTKSGDSIPIELGLQRVELTGVAPFIHGLGRDIRNRLETEKKLREQEEGQQALFDCLNEAVLKVNRSGKILAFNPSALKVLGLDAETLQAFDFRQARSDLTDAEGRPIPPDEFPLERTFATGEACSSKVFGARRADGQQQWFLISTSPIKLSATGVVEVAVVSITDFTLQQRAKLELVQARAVAEASNMAKTEFLAVMSHEIRTPLNGVIGFTDLLLNSTLDENSRRFAETIRESGEALLSVVNEILDFSKIEAGRLELEYEVFPLLHSVEEVINNLSARADSKNLELIVDVSPEVGPEWAGDRGRLRQILTNLIGNAVKFTERGSVELIIEVTPEGGLEFQVHDTGPGMSSSEVEKLFQKFSQVRRNALPTEGGTGLGLSIVKQLVEMMGGTVGCSSRPGEGSIFWFRLPPPKPGILQSSPTPAPPEMGRSKVLLASNSESVRRALTRRLKAWSFSVETLKSTSELQTELRNAFDANNPYDVVIFDDRRFAVVDNGDDIRLPDLLDYGPPAVIYICGRDHHRRVPSNRSSHAILWKPVVFPDALRQALLTAWVGSRLKNPSLESSAQEIKPRILVVEDDRVSAMLAAYLLDRMGCEVRIANSGEEGIAFCRNEAYDLIFLDGTLPGMDGPAAAREIRAGQGRYRQVPIIAVTGSVRPEDERRYRAAGMDGVLAKPLRSEELKSALSRWIVLPQEASSS